MSSGTTFPATGPCLLAPRKAMRLLMLATKTGAMAFTSLKHSRRKHGVFDEQGLGDAIQFARYLLILAEQGARVTFFCRKRLQRLFKGLDKPIRIVDCVEPNERFDDQIAPSSLPHAFKTRLVAIPARLSSLRAEDSLGAQVGGADRIAWLQDGHLLGGNPNVKADPARSVPLACFPKLARMDGVRLISIQQMDVCAQDKSLPGLIVPGEVFDAGADAFVDTAAVMQNLD